MVTTMTPNLPPIFANANYSHLSDFWFLSVLQY